MKSRASTAYTLLINSKIDPLNIYCEAYPEV